MMEQKRCKSKKCNRVLPENYPHKYCEFCRTKQIGQMKRIGATTLSVIPIAASAAIQIATKGAIKLKK